MYFVTVLCLVVIWEPSACSVSGPQLDHIRCYNNPVILLSFDLPVFLGVNIITLKIKLKMIVMVESSQHTPRTD